MYRPIIPESFYTIEQLCYDMERRRQEIFVIKLVDQMRQKVYIWNII